MSESEKVLLGDIADVFTGYNRRRGLITSSDDVKHPLELASVRRVDRAAPMGILSKVESCTTHINVDRCPPNLRPTKHVLELYDIIVANNSQENPRPILCTQAMVGVLVTDGWHIIRAKHRLTGPALFSLLISDPSILKAGLKTRGDRKSLSIERLKKEAVLFESIDSKMLAETGDVLKAHTEMYLQLARGPAITRAGISSVTTDGEKVKSAVLPCSIMIADEMEYQTSNFSFDSTQIREIIIEASKALEEVELHAGVQKTNYIPRKEVLLWLLEGLLNSMLDRSKSTKASVAACPRIVEESDHLSDTIESHLPILKTFGLDLNLAERESFGVIGHNDEYEINSVEHRAYGSYNTSEMLLKEFSTIMALNLSDIHSAFESLVEATKRFCDGTKQLHYSRYKYDINESIKPSYDSVDALHEPGPIVALTGLDASFKSYAGMIERPSETAEFESWSGVKDREIVMHQHPARMRAFRLEKAVSELYRHVIEELEAVSDDEARALMVAEIHNVIYQELYVYGTPNDDLLVGLMRMRDVESPEDGDTVSVAFHSYPLGHPHLLETNPRALIGGGREVSLLSPLRKGVKHPRFLEETLLEQTGNHNLVLKDVTKFVADVDMGVSGRKKSESLETEGLLTWNSEEEELEKPKKATSHKLGTIEGKRIMYMKKVKHPLYNRIGSQLRLKYRADGGDDITRELNRLVSRMGPESIAVVQLPIEFLTNVEYHGIQECLLKGNRREWLTRWGEDVFIAKKYAKGESRQEKEHPNLVECVILLEGQEQRGKGLVPKVMLVLRRGRSKQHEDRILMIDVNRAGLGSDFSFTPTQVSKRPDGSSRHTDGVRISDAGFPTPERTAEQIASILALLDSDSDDVPGDMALGAGFVNKNEVISRRSLHPMTFLGSSEGLVPRIELQIMQNTLTKWRDSISKMERHRRSSTNSG